MTILPIQAPAPRRGFTLIELLIVVSIISILSAIAVPNFLAAQTRAKVARTANDLRSLSTAIESYRVDCNRYPQVGDPAAPSVFDKLVPFTFRLKAITSPIGYIAVLPTDPFARSGQPEGNGLGFVDSGYAYGPGNLFTGSPAQYNDAVYRNSIYSVSGRGPDGNIFVGNYCMAHPTSRELLVHGTYDPTNGTVSEGDIVRLGSGAL